MQTPKDSATKFVRSLDGNYFMLREAAESLKVSHATLRKFIKDDNEKLGPSKCVWFGKSKIYLYTTEDINKISKYLESRKEVFDNDETQPKLSGRGRPAIWSPEEKKERQRKFARVSYYKRKAQAMLAIGTTEQYLEAIKKAEQITKELKEEK
jgi:hypothetical protein